MELLKQVTWREWLVVGLFVGLTLTISFQLWLVVALADYLMQLIALVNPNIPV